MEFSRIQKLGVYIKDAIKKAMRNIAPEWILARMIHPGFRKYFMNTGWLFVGKMTALTASFFVSVYVARYLGPERYGIMNYAMSFAGLFLFIASFGIDSILSRELIKFPEKRDELLGTGFFVKVIGGLLTPLFIIFALFIIRDDMQASFLTILFSLSFVFQSFSVIDLYFQSRVMSRNTVRVQLFSIVVSTLIKIALIMLGAETPWFIGVYIADSIILSIGLVLSYIRNGNGLLQWRFSKTLLTKILADSWPLMLSSAAVGIYVKIDQVMIRHFLGNEAVGIYAVAARLSEVWYFIPALICSSVFPAIINARVTSLNEYGKRLRSLYSLMIWSSITLSLFVTIFADSIIYLLFGSSYVAAAGVLRIYVWASIGVFLGFAVNQYLIAENYTKIILFSGIFGAVANVFLNIILLPKYGIMGSAVASFASYLLATFSVVFFKKTRQQGLLFARAFLKI